MLRISMTWKVSVWWGFIPVQNESKCQISEFSHGTGVPFWTGSLDCNLEWPLCWESVGRSVSASVVEHNQWRLSFWKQQCGQLTSWQAEVNSCFPFQEERIREKGERGSEKRDMRSTCWSILSQQVRWQSLLLSPEPHETPEVLTWAYHWLSTHAAGGQRLDALCSHREPTVSLLTQGPFRQES